MANLDETAPTAETLLSIEEPTEKEEALRALCLRLSAALLLPLEEIPLAALNAEAPEKENEKTIIAIATARTFKVPEWDATESQKAVFDLLQKTLKHKRADLEHAQTRFNQTKNLLEQQRKTLEEAQAELLLYDEEHHAKLFDNLKRHVEVILADGFWVEPVLQKHHVRMVSNVPCVLSSEDAPEIYLGYFELAWSLTNELRIYPAWDNKYCVGSEGPAWTEPREVYDNVYYHPFIECSGLPCFGFYQEVVNRAIGEGRLDLLGRYSKQLLTGAYTQHANPYVPLHCFGKYPVIPLPFECRSAVDAHPRVREMQNK